MKESGYRIKIIEKEVGCSSFFGKPYEQTNHLGNVLAVISDKKICNSPGGYDTALYYTADVIMAQDYYPFGSEMPGRIWTQNSKSSYRYAFSGQEHDDEVCGLDNDYGFKFRFADTRLGRFLSIDPLSRRFPYNSPYAFAENRTIEGKELEGLETVDTKQIYVAGVKTGYQTTTTIDPAANPVPKSTTQLVNYTTVDAAGKVTGQPTKSAEINGTPTGLVNTVNAKAATGASVNNIVSKLAPGLSAAETRLPVGRQGADRIQRSSDRSSPEYSRAIRFSLLQPLSAGLERTQTRETETSGGQHGN